MKFLPFRKRKPKARRKEIPPEAVELIRQARIDEAIRMFPNHQLEIMSEAADLVARVVRETWGDAPLWNQRGVDFSRAGDYGRAEEAFNKAIQEAPRYVPAYLHRGILYAVTGRRREALADFRIALQVDPTDKRARAMLNDAEAGNWSKFRI